jgi:hypothetical protein
MRIFLRSFTFNTAWQLEEKQKHTAYIEIHFFFKGMYFSVNVNNKGFTSRNIFTALLNALESETVGMQKYNTLKDRVRTIGAWQRL